jgi:cyclopropane-fatty-acyl-phospholipid synthase
MLLHTITISDAQAGPVKQLPVTMTLLRFKFVMTEIFPGGQLPGIETVKKHAATAGFAVGQVQSLQPHYARTLDLWAAALQGHEAEAVAIQSDEVYQRYVKYLTGCADLFRNGYTDVCQFTLARRC